MSPRAARAESPSLSHKERATEGDDQLRGLRNSGHRKKPPRGQFDITALGIGGVSDKALAATEPMGNE